MIDSYLCHCEVVKPLSVHGEDSGLCFYCTMVYDEALYEKKLRQYQPGFEADESLHDYLLRQSNDYKHAVLISQV